MVVKRILFESKWRSTWYNAKWQWTAAREDVPKELITKLNEQASDRQEKALTKASTPAKTTEATLATPTTTMSNVVSPTMATACEEEKQKESDKAKQKEEHPDMEEVVEVESDAESNSVLVIDDPAAGVAKDSAGPGSVLESGSSDPSAVPLAKVGESTYGWRRGGNGDRRAGS